MPVSLVELVYRTVALPAARAHVVDRDLILMAASDAATLAAAPAMPVFQARPTSAPPAAAALAARTSCVHMNP
jgi:hypothetical protein